MKFGQNEFMKLALTQARLAFDSEEVPIGAVIVENNQIIAASYNQTRKLKDVTAHAEILALRLAMQKTQSLYLENCDLYTTVEPCAMCLAAISFAKIRNIYYGCREPKFGAIENHSHIFMKNSSYYKPNIFPDIAASEARDLMQKFFLAKREKS